MRSTWRACLLQFLGWIALSAIAYLYVRPAQAAIGVGLLAFLAISFVIGIFGAARERRMLMRGTTEPLPQDDGWLAVSGEIRAASPLRAPLSHERVVAYEYRITKDKPMGRKQGSAPMVYFDGKALAASSIGSAHGAVRVLAVPTLEVSSADLSRVNVVANANEHVRTASFEPRDTAAQRTKALEREWDDDDGMFRIDKRDVKADIEVTDRFHFEEKHVRQGETVSAFGYWSASRRGLVPDPQWGRSLRIMRGNTATIAAALQRRMGWYMFWALVFAAGAATLAIYNQR